MNLINGNHHLCERRKYTFMVPEGHNNFPVAFTNEIQTVLSFPVSIKIQFSNLIEFN